MRTLRELWWWIRGVSATDYRAVCARCGRTGQAHWSWRGCRRFLHVNQETNRGR